MPRSDSLFRQRIRRIGFALAKNESLRSSELQDILRIDRPNFRKCMRDLQDLELIVGEKKSGDQRYVYYSLTDLGRVWIGGIYRGCRRAARFRRG
jgi:DNA-binding MarR family transcriptional regulator